MAYVATALFTRPDTISPFFYDYFGLESNPDFIRLITTAKQVNKCYRDSWVTTPNGLTLLRVIIWVDRVAYKTYYDDPWHAIHSNWTTDGYQYCTDHGHTLTVKGGTIHEN